ncbi:hypothetical protein CCAX7_35760 [Capsulimonas corticalis]|uniref:Uncharacterized protein n=1 Tax=Capsulimonas corticalis TaxID=2219043 RepID=A0A402D613_9BACT|nr:CRISPR-associated protein Csx19 [Capsulimonas corticalis]BDI31525.1 hypothetical protein CCAX7_35760 [Capsulimonas corticalis]
MTTPTSREISGANLVAIHDPSECLRWLLEKGADAPIGFSSPTVWAVVQCGDTLAWGQYGQAQWRWTSELDSEVRAPAIANLFEARVFSREREALIWRRDDGKFAGRTVTDATISDALLAPIDEEWLFEGKVSGSQGDLFVSRKLLGGNVSVTPQGRGVCIRHYVEADLNTGLLHIALSRFLELLR